jgi:uncharacterized protein
MSGWTDYAERARAKGVLAKELFMVRSTPVVPLGELAAALPEHLAYQRELESRGVLVFAGPLSDATGQEWSGEGLVIYRAAGIEEAREIAARDPIHQKGLRRFELRAWLLNEGNLSISLSLSTQKLGLS